MDEKILSLYCWKVVVAVDGLVDVAVEAGPGC